MLQAQDAGVPAEASGASVRVQRGFHLPFSRGNGLEPNRVTYQQILSEFQADPFFTNDRYDFEHLVTHLLAEGEDLEEAIKQHVKVALDPNKEYVIHKPVKIKTLCYIIGNGAKVKIACKEPFGFEVYCRSPSPGIVGMWAVTFHNIVFERDRTMPGGVVNSRTFVLFHGCNFLGCMGTALSFSCGSEIRGCHFFACYKCIDSSQSKLKLTVSRCVFEACMVGIISNGNLSCRHCTGHNVYCLCYLLGPGKFVGLNILNSNKFYESGLTEMLSCHGNKILPLATLHICSSFHPFPDFKNSMLTRCKVFVGERIGVFSPVNVSLSYSSVVADKGSFQSLNLNYTFHQTTTIWKLLRSSQPEPVVEVKKCLCGGVHPWPVLEQLNFTARALPNPYDSSCDSKMFDSDDDE